MALQLQSSNLELKAHNSSLLEQIRLETEKRTQLLSQLQASRQLIGMGLGPPVEAVVGPEASAGSSAFSPLPESSHAMASRDHQAQQLLEQFAGAINALAVQQQQQEQQRQQQLVQALQSLIQQQQQGTEIPGAPADGVAALAAAAAVAAVAAATPSSAPPNPAFPAAALSLTGSGVPQTNYSNEDLQRIALLLALHCVSQNQNQQNP